MIYQLDLYNPLRCTVCLSHNSGLAVQSACQHHRCIRGSKMSALWSTWGFELSHHTKGLCILKISSCNLHCSGIKQQAPTLLSCRMCAANVELLWGKKKSSNLTRSSLTLNSCLWLWSMRRCCSPHSERMHYTIYPFNEACLLSNSYLLSRWEIKH